MILDDYKMNTFQEKIVDVLCDKTGNNDRSFFRVMVVYKMAELACNMRASVNFAGTKNIPVNVYALDLAPSGYSKNASMNILEKEVFRKAKDEFLLHTWETESSTNLDLLAVRLSSLKGIDTEDARIEIGKEWDRLPRHLYNFGSSTAEGFKALRTKLDMAGIGATSQVLDEIGTNLAGNQEVFGVQLETFDMGENKQKLIKTDGGNRDVGQSVPSCLFAFGTQSKLFDAGNTEKLFFEKLEEGYGRRLIIGYVPTHKRDEVLTVDEVYEKMTNPTTISDLVSYSDYLKTLVVATNANKTLTMDKEVEKKFIEYRLHCDNFAGSLKEHEEIYRAVLMHGYWRAIKIAGVYAWIDGKDEVEMEHFESAVALVEECNKNFKKMLTRKKPYEKLADYIVDAGRELTQVDLTEDLSFYRGSESQKNELLRLSTAYAYNNNMVLKNTIKDGIEFFSGEKLEETDIDKIQVSYSSDVATGYKVGVNKFELLHQLVTRNGLHYCSHGFKDGHRKADNAIKGFNLLILDVDSGLDIDVCKHLLRDYTFLIATTKSHTPDVHRYRIILPMSHKLYLSKDEYKSFMKNVFSWLPFDSDEQTGEIARKWQSHKGDYTYNYGSLIDVMRFIPNTSKEAKFKKRVSTVGDSDVLQKWFLLNYNWEEEGRNNMLIRYGLSLLDDGMSSDNIRYSMLDLNNKIDKPLSEKEIESTCMKTIIRKEIEMETK